VEEKDTGSGHLKWLGFLEQIYDHNFCEQFHMVIGYGKP